MFYVSDYKNTINTRDIIKIRRFNRKRNLRKVRNRGKLYILLKCFSELLDGYCKYSSLHGLKYFRDSSLHRIDRMFWLAIFLACLYVSGIIAWNTYLAGITNEFQLKYEPTSTPVWEIPFPAVVVCSVYPVRKSVFDIDKQVHNAKLRHYSKLICRNKAFFGADVFNDTIDEEFLEFLVNAGIPCRDFILNCHWHGKDTDCCTLFHPIVTPMGLCYVFNSLPGEVKYRYFRPAPGQQEAVDNHTVLWDVEKGYPSDEGHDGSTRPLRVRAKGPLSGLTFDLVDMRNEWQEACTGPSSGFVIYIYSPDSFFVTQASMRIPYDIHSHLQLNPNLITAEESVRSVDVEMRDCVFKDELKLEYFRYYSQSGCQVECFIKMTLRRCGCVVFNDHSVVGNLGYPYCNDSSTYCISTVFDYIQFSMMSTANETNRECECITDCFQLSYDVKKSFQRFESKPKGVDNDNNIGRVSIYFDHENFNVVKRVRTTTLIDTLGNCGGLLGLLFGFSFMSLFEVIYFALIQPIRKLFIFCIKSRA